MFSTRMGSLGGLLKFGASVTRGLVRHRAAQGGAAEPRAFTAPAVPFAAEREVRKGQSPGTFLVLLSESRNGSCAEGQSTSWALCKPG